MYDDLKQWVFNLEKGKDNRWSKAVIINLFKNNQDRFDAI
jgi:hypothetical protein